MQNQAKVVIRPTRDNLSVGAVVEEILELMGWREIVQADRPVFIKLNLSSIMDATKQAANTDTRIVEGVCRTIAKKAKSITLVESDGMRYSAEEAFRKNGIYELAQRLGVNVLNLSKDEQIYGLHPLLEDFGLPRTLVRPDKTFISLPVLKTHALTALSGALKNQWGCIPRHDRILLHKHLDQLIAILNTLFKPQLAIMDGIWAMEGRGPTSGKPRYLGVVLGSREPVSLDATAMRLVGLDPYSARHLVMAAGEELGPIGAGEIEIDGPFEIFKTKFEPARLDWAVRWMNDLSQYKFFVHRILLNQAIFRAVRGIVRALRAVGVVR